MKEKNTVPDFERVCEANISKVVFSEDKVKKKSEILISHLRKTIYIRILKELSVNLSVPLSILYTASFKQQKQHINHM